jgi:hypothetical protein
LIILKALDKVSESVSSFVPHSFVFAFIALLMLFLKLELALWLGDILGKLFYGFFVVAAFYFITGFAVNFFIYKWLKRLVSDYFINQ